MIHTYNIDAYWQSKEKLDNHLLHVAHNIGPAF